MNIIKDSRKDGLPPTGAAIPVHWTSIKKEELSEVKKECERIDSLIFETKV